MGNPHAVMLSDITYSDITPEKIPFTEGLRKKNQKSTAPDQGHRECSTDISRQFLTED